VCVCVCVRVCVCARARVCVRAFTFCLPFHDTFMTCMLLYKHIFGFMILSLSWQATLVKWFITISAMPWWCHCFQCHLSATWRSGMSSGRGTVPPPFLTMTTMHCYNLHLTPRDSVLCYATSIFPLRISLLLKCHPCSCVTQFYLGTPVAPHTPIPYTLCIYILSCIYIYTEFFISIEALMCDFLCNSCQERKGINKIKRPNTNPNQTA